MNARLSRWLLSTIVLLLLGNLAGAAEPANKVQLAGTSWKLLGLGPNGAIEAALPTLMFGDGGKVSGSGGCNTFTGTVTSSGMVIKFGPLAATKKSCSEQINQQEAAYLKALEEAQTFEIRATSLLINTKKFAEPLSFVPKE
jgi:heat shock protein HslJ